MRLPYHLRLQRRNAEALSQARRDQNPEAYSPRRIGIRLSDVRRSSTAELRDGHQCSTAALPTRGGSQRRTTVPRVALIALWLRFGPPRPPTRCPSAPRPTTSRPSKPCSAPVWSTTRPTIACRASSGAAVLRSAAPADLRDHRPAHHLRQAGDARHAQDVLRECRAGRREHDRRAVPRQTRGQRHHHHQCPRLRSCDPRSRYSPSADLDRRGHGLNVAFDSSRSTLPPKEQIEEAETRLFALAETGRE